MFGKSRIATFAAAAAMTGLIGGAGLVIVGCADKPPATTTTSSCNGKMSCKAKTSCKADATPATQPAK